VPNNFAFMQTPPEDLGIYRFRDNLKQINDLLTVLSKTPPCEKTLPNKTQVI
jgi:hypothetical protein